MNNSSNITCYYHFEKIFLKDELENQTISGHLYRCPGDRVCCEPMNCCTTGTPAALSLFLYLLLACTIVLTIFGLSKWCRSSGGRSCQFCLSQICLRQ